ncbi:MAG TPA: hypothetical protein VIJ21_08125 [Solirubrobacterales bacterium]
MSILDDAIREHLELKRAHGADDSEVKRLEDEAFGPPQRPDEVDPFAEAPTEFLVAPGETPADLPEVGDEAERSGRRPNITDLQEAPPAEAPVVEDELSPAPDAPPPSPADAADAPLPPPVDVGPTAEERHAIADQPTQMFDVQAELDADAPAAAAEQPSPTDEQLVDAAQEEPQAAPPAPEDSAAGILAFDEPAGPPTEIHGQPPLDIRGPDAEVAGHPPAEAAPPEEESAEYDFLNEQRLADELDQALEVPITDEHCLPTYEDAPAAAGGGIFDFESAGQVYQDDPSEEALRRVDAPEPPSEEASRPAPEPPSEEAARPAPEPPSEETPQAAVEPPVEEDDTDFDPDTGHEDVLEDTPKFLEDAPEDDDLWFEQKPPKDFDLD